MFKKTALFWNEGIPKRTCNETQNMPGFSLAWETKQINGTTKKQEYGVLDVIDETKEWDKSYYVDTIHDYQNFLSKKVRYTIVRPARQYNMTDKEIWEIVKTWKKRSFAKKPFHVCVRCCRKRIFHCNIRQSKEKDLIRSTQNKLQRNNRWPFPRFWHILLYNLLPRRGNWTSTLFRKPFQYRKLANYPPIDDQHLKARLQVRKY